MPDAPAYDLIVIGSGAAGGWVAKEAAERGLKVLILEAGRALDPVADFPPPDHEGGSRVSILTRVLSILKGQSVQARCMSFTPQTAHLFINDRQNPYTTTPGSRFNWYRSRQVGGRLHLWGRNALRISDLDLKAADADGFGDTWPISLADLDPWYTRVEEFLGVAGEPAGIENLPDGSYSGPHPLTKAEQKLMAEMAEKWPDRPATTCRIIHHMTDRRTPPLKAALDSGNAELRTLWEKELGEMRDRIKIMRKALDRSPLAGQLQTLARYHLWATRRLFEAVDALPEADYLRDMGLFFASVHGTLEHLLVCDVLWWRRFAHGESPVIRLDAQLEPERAALEARLLSGAAAWEPFVEALDDARLAGTLDYRTTRGNEVSLPFAVTLAHVFNHGTHHRGQISAALTALGRTCPELDLVYMLVQQQKLQQQEAAR